MNDNIEFQILFFRNTNQAWSTFAIRILIFNIIIRDLLKHIAQIFKIERANESNFFINFESHIFVQLMKKIKRIYNIHHVVVMWTQNKRNYVEHFVSFDDCKNVNDEINFHKRFVHIAK